MTSPLTSTTSVRRCSVLTTTLLLLLAVAANFPSGALSSAIRPASSAVSTDVAAGSSPLVPSNWHGTPNVPADVPASDAGRTVVREKRTLLKLKPLIVLPVKVALGTGAKLVAGAKLGAKAVGVGSKALGVSLVGLKAAHKVAKVTVKAATALGVKAVLLNFLFQKINQVIDFKTRLLSNLDQRNRQQNAQFLSPVLTQSSSSAKSGSIGNKEDDDFLASAPGTSDQQVLAQEQIKSSAIAPAVAPLEDDSEVTFDANKVTLQIPDRLFGPSFTAVNGISQTIGNVIQNAAGRLARLVDAIKAAFWRKAAGVSAISNSSGSSSGGGGGGGSSSTRRPTANRGSRDAAADLQNNDDDGLDLDPLDEAASASSPASPAKPNATGRADGAGNNQ
ncbi:uncharacterized protein LOC112595764 isoform X1 [Melanaphis sacchari]|uniref:uncharacterized protein LOC112595764 isoform X1 n=1 Tax=Melanaphis sacchari TaxID=742174 RepID=UPI000DC1496C|nr:uncharacterized protein LOC112595764 isoform X1 [Melanaphis sacchari]